MEPRNRHAHARTPGLLSGLEVEPHQQGSGLAPRVAAFDRVPSIASGEAILTHAACEAANPTQLSRSPRTPCQGVNASKLEIAMPGFLQAKILNQTLTTLDLLKYLC